MLEKGVHLHRPHIACIVPEAMREDGGEHSEDAERTAAKPGFPVGDNTSRAGKLRDESGNVFDNENLVAIVQCLNCRQRDTGLSP